MISLDNARKWSNEAHESKWEERLEKWVVRVGDDWVQTFRDRMSQAMVAAIEAGHYEATVEFHSPEYRTSEKVDEWQAFIGPDLEKLLLEYEALGFQDGASEGAGARYMTKFFGHYHVSINWGYRKRGPGVHRVRYA